MGVFAHGKIMLNSAPNSFSTTANTGQAMPWIQIKLNATNENAEQIGDMLMEETEALSVTFLDAQEHTCV